MNNVIAAILPLSIIFLAVMGIVFLTVGLVPGDLINACNKNGYWQTGQTRIICYVEEKNE